MPRKQKPKILTVQAPRTTEDALKVHKRLSRLESLNRINLGGPKFKRSPNRGNGSNRNYEPQNKWGIPSTHIVRKINAEGNMAEVPLTSNTATAYGEIHPLSEDERKIRKMKNKGRKLRRMMKHRRRHGRTVRVAN